MSALSNLSAASPSLARQDRRSGLGATLKRWWVAYMTWRIERAAMAHLRSMSDRQLEDIGISRSDIFGAVSRGKRTPASWYR